MSDLDGATYTKRQKEVALGVPRKLLEAKTAVCPEVAKAMAVGALQASRADVPVAITGVAGPMPDEDGNPVGRAYVACAGRSDQCAVHHLECGDVHREEILDRCMRTALGLLRQMIAENQNEDAVKEFA